MPRIKIISTPHTKSQYMNYGGPYLAGLEMQQGGYPIVNAPASFTPAGSFVDQQTWAMGANGTPVAPPTGNYYKSDPTQTAVPNPLPASTNGMTPRITTHQPMNNALSYLLPLNAGLNSLAQANDWHQRQNSQMQNRNNPLNTMAYDNGRTQESKFGYNTFQGGGETMPFAGVRIKLWQRGGNIPGAAGVLRPYMLHQGPFQGGGQSGMDLMDQWDIEDGQDAQDAAAATAIVPQEEQAYDTELKRRSSLSNEDDYMAAMKVALDRSINPYIW